MSPAQICASISAPRSMRRSAPLLLLLLLLALPSISASSSSFPTDACNSSSPLAGSEFDLVMVQHQLRGVVRILDGCSFSVRHFDMLRGSDRVVWWGASGLDFTNLTSGFPVSDRALNRTFRSESLTFRLSAVASWDLVSTLAVWDPATASDFGHALLLPPPSPSPSPAPAPSPSPPPAPYLPQPTTFDNCRALSPRYRVRWTLLADSVDIGLEASVSSQFYMAFGWGAPSSRSPSMIHADVAIAGFTDEGLPFADDYFISGYSECLLNKDGQVEGVCPDTLYEGSDPIGFVNNTRLVYGHRLDGVSFVRYRRPLVSRDSKYDVAVGRSENMTVIWSLGQLRSPDNFRPYYLPLNHRGTNGDTYGYLWLNLSESVDDCFGPLDAEDKEDQDLIFADEKTELNVATGPAFHYPNPPNPTKVLYINKREAPVLRVERGVPVKFSVQAGHDVAFYITSSPIGGNATSRNESEVVFAGDSESQGVPASPYELVWLPDRRTPDEVYYQSLFEEKMGWKIQVVDGGLSDMYNNSVRLDDQQVSFFWSLSEHSISIAARGEKKSGYLAIGFGSQMVNSFVYVGWIDGLGEGCVKSYWINGKDASNIIKTNESLTDKRCRVENGIVTFEFTRPLSFSCSDRVECKNIIDPDTPLRVIWAMGAGWSDGRLSEKNMHSLKSTRPVRVLLKRGSAEAEQDLRPVLAVHGFMMFVAWGIMLPGGVLAARYLKHVKGGGWYRIHVYLQYSGIAIVLLGLLFAAAELRGFNISSIHVKFGVTAIILACLQPVNACVRPKKPDSGEPVSSKRVVWEYFHFVTGRCAIVVGVAALISGLKHLENRYHDENVQSLKWALVIWFSVGAVLVVFLEYLEVKRRRNGRNLLRGSWILGNEEDDSVDLLSSDMTVVEPAIHTLHRMEVQLEPLSR